MKNKTIKSERSENEKQNIFSQFFASTAEYVKKNKGKLRGQLCDFAKLYQENPAKDKLIQLLLASERMPAKGKVVFGHAFYRQERLDGFITRILFLINKML